MGQVEINPLGALIKDVYHWIEEKDKLIFQSKIQIYNLSRTTDVTDEQVRIIFKKLKFDFEIIHLNINSTLQEITLHLLNIKDEQKKLETFYSFFQSFSIKKQPSYVLKQKNPEVTSRTKDSSSNLTIEEQLSPMQKYINNISQMTVYNELLDKIIELFACLTPSLEQTGTYSKGKLMQSKLVLQELLDLEYKQLVFDEDKFRNYFKFLVFVYDGIILDEVNAYPARKLNRNFKNSGFRATAYEVKHDGLKEVYFVFKGTEGTVTTFKGMVSDVIYNNFIPEALADWKYNFESIVLGTGKAQILDGIQFVRLIKKHLKPENCYATGHSLGGHLAQTIQLIDAPFEQVYTVNSAPIQIRQLYHLKPHLFSSKKWSTLMDHPVETAEWSNSNNDYINDVFSEESQNIVNETFELDFTRTLIYLHGTSLIGETNYYGTHLKDFPSKYKIREYFSEQDLLYLYELIEDNVDLNLKNEGAKSMLKGLFSMINEKNKVVPISNYKKRTVEFILKVLNYMEDNHLSDPMEIEKSRVSLLSVQTKDDTPPMEPSKKKQLSNVLMSLKNDLSFVLNINRDTMELIIYLHGMSGAKWIMRTGILEELSKKNH